jgi:flagellar biosynthesis protein FlhB
VADDKDRRTEPASARQIREARRTGKVPRSRDLGACVSLAVALLVLWAGADFWSAQLQTLGGYGINSIAATTRAGEVVHSALIGFWLRTVLLLSLSLLLPCAVVATLAHGVYAGWVFAPASIEPKFDRLDPAQNLKQMFAPKNWVELGKSTIKIVLLCGALWLVIAAMLPTLVRLPLLQSFGLPALIHQVLASFFALMLVGMALVAIFDAWYQRFNYLRELRMTREEVKRERRDDQGDPHQRAKRQQLLREVVQESPLERCAHATLILCSSGQAMAVAIFWDRASGQRPWLLHKGRDVPGLAIIQIGRDRSVPVIEDAALCARIYQQTGIDADLAPSLAESLTRYLDSP